MLCVENGQEKLLLTLGERTEGTAGLGDGIADSPKGVPGNGVTEAPEGVPEDGTAVEIQIADLSGSHYSLLPGEVAVFSRENTGYSLSCERAEEGMEDVFRDRILAELAFGKGPDILYLSREDLILLQEKGALADLEGLMSRDTLQELLPGAVELGRVEGKLCGIPGEVSARTIFTRPSLWGSGSGEDISWSVDDILDLAGDQGETQGLSAILPTVSDAILYYLALFDLERSPFIDWEGKDCSFASQKFISLLETIKAYSLDEVLILGKDREMLTQGRCLGVAADILSFSIYEGICKEMGEEIAAAGFPAEDGGHSYLAADGLLAINKACGHQEAAAAFLEYVLSARGQEQCNVISVRRDMLTEDMVLYRGEDQAPYRMENGARVYLAVKKDGTTYIDQYNAFLESCVPLPDPHEEIANIVSEEAESFFYGNKSAREAAEIIDNRVRTYLKEQE